MDKILYRKAGWDFFVAIIIIPVVITKSNPCHKECINVQHIAAAAWFENNS